MSGTHFYLTLPSNASLNEFPNNKTSYRVKLPQSIDLGGSGKLVCTPFPIQTPGTHYKKVWIRTTFMQFVSASHYGLRLLPAHAGAYQSCE